MSERFVIHVDPELKDLVPGYLERLKDSMQQMEAHLRDGDYEKIRFLGHNMKGSGGGYGFDRVSEIGLGLENAAKSGLDSDIKDLLGELESYLTNLEVHFG